jgi:two-component system, OmpR family, response regulator
LKNGPAFEMKILVIDDSQEIVEVLKFWLESEGVTVDAITDGSMGLDMIRNRQFDLILLDVAMPDFTGLDVIDSLKNEGLLESKNIIIFTASSDKNLFENLKDTGVKGILKKPSSLQELEKLLDKYRPAEDNTP